MQPVKQQLDSGAAQRELAQRATQLEQEACALQISKARFQDQVNEQLQKLDRREQQVARLEDYAQKVHEKERAVEVCQRILAGGWVANREP
jgi:nitrate/nitrite-specific signal transduction histidine kinase